MPDPLHDFAGVARQYCEWCEGTPQDRLSEARSAFEHLTGLVRAVLPLSAAHGGGADAPRVSDPEWKQMHARFGALPFQYYASPLDPLSLEPQQPGIGDLADDLADTWRDLKSGLCLYDRGDPGGALREWRFSFQVHWGKHATEAIHVLHCWLVENGES